VIHGTIGFHLNINIYRSAFGERMGTAVGSGVIACIVFGVIAVIGV